MKIKTTTFIILFFSGLSTIAFAQKSGDQSGVERACMDYIEGFYEGDTSKLSRSLDPGLYKFGFWKNAESGQFGDRIFMSYEEALKYALDVKEKKRFPSAEAPRVVEILDINNFIAAAKVRAWWGEDYLLLSKHSGKWKIEQVIWEGPLNQQQ